MDMDFLNYQLVLLLSSFVLVYFYLLRRNSRSSKLPLPPGPFPFPIIGNILQLGQNPHQSLAKLSETYGPLMRLKLGSKETIVASSPEMAREILQKHDQVCCSRVVPHVLEALDHHESSVVWLPGGDKWRKYRKSCREHLFTLPKLEASEGLRQEKLRQLRNYLDECCTSGRVVDIGEVVFVTLLNLISGTLFSIDFAQLDSSPDPARTNAQEMQEIIYGLLKVGGTPNPADFFPVLRPLDPLGLKRKSALYGGRLQDIFREIINQRMHPDSPAKKDLLQALLDLKKHGSDAGLSIEDINHLFVDLIIAGSDTSTDTVIWAMSELLRNPKKMSKVKEELKAVIGENKQVQESDVPRLLYLNAVIKETFRCHPTAPLLIPHKAEAEVEINGYRVPKDAEILLNVWAIGRDSRIWSNPDSFEPERFLGSKVDYRGKDFELLPFGSGRRMCPGLPLAHLGVHLMVASMVHNFEWRLEPGVKPEELDMTEVFGITLHRAVPLKAFVNHEI